MNDQKVIDSIRTNEMYDDKTKAYLEMIEKTHFTFRDVLNHLLTLSEETLDEKFSIKTDCVFVSTDNYRVVEYDDIDESDVKKNDYDGVYISITKAYTDTENHSCNLFSGTIHS